MGRRKTKRRRSSTAPSDSISSLVDMLAAQSGADRIDVLQRLTQIAGSSSIEDLLADCLPAPTEVEPIQAPATPTSHNQGRSEADWFGGIEYIHEQLPPNLTSRSAKLKASFLEVSDSEFVMTRVRDGKKAFVAGVFCDAGRRRIDTISDCNCGDMFCVHVHASASLIINEMKVPDSEVRKKILTKLKLVEDRSSIPGGTTLLQLDAILGQNFDKLTDEPFDFAIASDRILWRVRTTNHRVQLIPVLQKRKKRGDGWTKGREISPSSLSTGNHSLSPVDLRVLQAADNTYYLEFEPYESLELMIGHDAVEYQGKPAVVSKKPFELAVQWTEDKSELAVLSEPGADRVFVEEHGLIVFRRQSISLIECPHQMKPLVRAAIHGDLRVPADRADELLDRMRQFSNMISIQLPKDAYTKTRNIKVEPVLRLKSNKSGVLRCGLRVREGTRLHVPGQGQLVRYEDADGNLIQHNRNARTEVETCQTLRSTLDLPASANSISEWDWQFEDLDNSLSFLARLRELGDSAGVEALWDEDSVDPVNVLGSLSPQNVRVDVKRKKDWFGIDGGVQLGGQNFTLPELLSAIESEPAKGFTELRPGMWAKVSERLRKRLIELRDAAHVNRSKLELDITAIPVIQSLQESQLDVTASKEWEECVQRMNKAQKINPKPSKKFAADLRDYQLNGYRWMRRLAEWGVGACLADDMGLGKTVQTLAVLVDRAKKGPTLVIAPTSVGFNWQREAERFAPTLKPALYRETDRTAFLGDVGAGDLVICSYGLALRDAEALAGVEWGTLVLDEAQFIKNSRSKTAQAIRTFNADWRLALTGTPIENHLGELWSLFRSISPGIFGSWEQFRKRFAAPIEKQNDPERRRALSRLITPFILRRTKSEVLKDLPERTEINLHVDLTKEERARYDEMRLAAVGELNQIAGLPDTNDQRFRILAILTRLRQLACHISMVDDAWEGDSAKLQLLIETVRELKDEGHRVLIFSQFTKYLSLIRQAFETEKVSFEYLDGKTPAKTRQERVDRFQEGNTDAFLISLKAGGTGLNLTAADYVIHMDPWWNPAVEDQATDRSHRIGQTKPVIVYRIIARDTVEDQILSLHADKRDLVSGIMEGTQKAGAMSTNELLDLIRSN